MDVRFVIGRAGSGKTSFLRDRLVDHLADDPLQARAIYLVPKQATFMTQRALALDARLGGFIGVRVAAPDDLAETALIETGHSAGALLDPVGRALIIGLLLRTHAAELPHFGRSARQPGLAAQIDQAFSEFEHAGADLAEIETVIDNQPAGSPLARKLTDLKFLYEHYQRYLTGHGFDPMRRQTLAPQAISNWPEAKRALVLVDDFYDFTAFERLIIVALAKSSATCRIALTIDPKSPVVRDANNLPDDLSLLGRSELAYRRMHFALSVAGAPPSPPKLLTERLRFGGLELAAVERCLDAPAAAASGGAVKFIVAGDARDEIDAAAREIKSLLAGGMRQRDIAVLSRSVASLAEPIAASFSAHGIGYFLDRRRPARHHPLLRTLSAIAQIAISQWSHESVFELAKAGLTPLVPAATDLLEDYIIQHRIPPAQWTADDAWIFRRRAEEAGERQPQFGEADLVEVNRARAVLRDGLGVIGTPAWAVARSVRGRVTDLVAAMHRLDVQTSVLALIDKAKDDPERALEHEQAWNAVREVLDRFVDLLGDVELAGIEFSQLLQSTLAGLDFAIAPPTLDQVLVGSIDRTRTGPVKATILLGMNECQFPLCGSERAVLNDADRYHLLRGGLEIDPPTRDALLSERFLAYLALTRASERLTLIRVERDEQGNEQAPSPFWNAVSAVIQNAPVERAIDAIDRVSTAAQAVTLGLHAARQSPAGPQGQTAVLYNWMTTRPTVAISKTIDAAWPSLAYRNAAALSPAIAGRLFAPPLLASVSRFESFAACPFQHFARYGLRLRPPVDPSVTAMDLGNLYHAVLERVVGDAISRRIDFTGVEHISPAHIREAAQRVSVGLADQVFLTSAQNRFTVEQLERCVLKSLRAQQAILARGDFRPAFTELVFGDGKQLPALTLHTAAGHEVKLRGKIDRIDLDPTETIFSVIDYKFGGQQFDCGAVRHGLMLQLLTYLLVLRKSGNPNTGAPLTPAAGLYVRLLRTIDSVGHPGDAPRPDIEEFHLKTKPRGVINRAHAGRFDANHTGYGDSDVIPFAVKKDGQLSARGNDALEEHHFHALIDFVERRITELADHIIAGEISASPYLIGKETPCQRCDLQQVCRFEPSINGYRRLEAHSRAEALELIQLGVASAR